jgi:hypothetical protein
MVPQDKVLLSLDILNGIQTIKAVYAFYPTSAMPEETLFKRCKPL